MAYFCTYFTKSKDGITGMPQNILLRQTHPIDWALIPIKDLRTNGNKDKTILFWKEIPDYFLDNPQFIDGYSIED